VAHISVSSSSLRGKRQPAVGSHPTHKLWIGAYSSIAAVQSCVHEIFGLLNATQSMCRMCTRRVHSKQFSAKNLTSSSVHPPFELFRVGPPVLLRFMLVLLFQIFVNIRIVHSSSYIEDSVIRYLCAYEEHINCNQ
jgi:hypothetical protein